MYQYNIACWQNASNCDALIGLNIWWWVYYKYTMHMKFSPYSLIYIFSQQVAKMEENCRGDQMFQSCLFLDSDGENRFPISSTEGGGGWHWTQHTHRIYELNTMKQFKFETSHIGIQTISKLHNSKLPFPPLYLPFVFTPPCRREVSLDLAAELADRACQFH